MLSATGLAGTGDTTPYKKGRAQALVQRKQTRLRTIKIVCALLLGICFWYAVPYRFPLQLETNTGEAALSEADAFQGNLSRQIAMPAALLLCVIALSKLPARGQLQRGRLTICVTAYILWAATSLAWSADPALTRKRLVVFLIDVVTAYTLARLATVQEVAALGFAATGVVALLALFAHTCVLHDFRPWDPDFRFMGVMTANYQAMNLFVCLTCGLTLFQAWPGAARALLPLLALFATLLFLTRARVGTMLFAVALIIMTYRWIKARMLPHARILCLLVIAAVGCPMLLLAVGQDGGRLFTSVFMMGRTDTENTSNLSNRAPLWSELAGSVASKPWLGAGFAAFWTPERVEQISIDQGWVVPHAHNTYLDETLSLGLVGGALYLTLIVGGLGTAWRQLKRQPGPFTLLPVLLLGWLALLGLTESIPLAPNLPTLLAYACIARSCMRPVKEPIEPSPILRRRGPDPCNAFVRHAGLQEQVL